MLDFLGRFVSRESNDISSEHLKNHGKRSTWIIEVLDTVSTSWYRELETEGYTVQWSVANSKSPNEGIDIVADLLVGFRVVHSCWGVCECVGMESDNDDRTDIRELLVRVGTKFCISEFFLTVRCQSSLRYFYPSYIL